MSEQVFADPQIDTAENTPASSRQISSIGSQLWQIINIPEKITPHCNILEQNLHRHFTSGVLHAIYLAGGEARVGGTPLTLAEVASEVGAEYVEPGWWVLDDNAILVGSAEEFAHLEDKLQRDQLLLAWTEKVFLSLMERPAESGQLTRAELHRKSVQKQLRVDTRSALTELINNIGVHSHAERAIITFAMTSGEDGSQIEVRAADNGEGIPTSVFKKTSGAPRYDKREWIRRRRQYIERWYSDFGADVLELVTSALFRSDTVGHLGDSVVNVRFGGGGLSRLAGGENGIETTAVVASTDLLAHGSDVLAVSKRGGEPPVRAPQLQLPGVRGTLVESYLADK